jgi:hypothetical protein
VCYGGIKSWLFLDLTPLQISIFEHGCYSSIKPVLRRDKGGWTFWRAAARHRWLVVTHFEVPRAPEGAKKSTNEQNQLTQRRQGAKGRQANKGVLLCAS